MKKILITLGILVFSTAISAAYKVKDIEKVLNRNDKQLSKLSRNLEKDFKDKSQLQGCFDVRAGDKESPEIKQLQGKFKELQETQAAVNSTREAIQRRANEVRALTDKKKLLKDSDPAFKQVQDHLDAMESESKTLEKQIDQYTKVSNSLRSEVQKKKLVIVDFSDLKRSLDSADRSTADVVREAKAQIEEAKKALADSNVKKKDKKMKTLDQMNQLLSEAEQESASSQRVARELSALYPNGGNVCLGSHHSAYAFISDLKGHSKRIGKITKELKKLEKEFRK